MKLGKIIAPEREEFVSWAEQRDYSDKRPKINREALVMANKRHGLTERSAKGNNHQGARARMILAGMADIERRAKDPLEQAKDHLRRRGHIVFASTVTGGPRGQHVLNGKTFTDQEIIDRAIRCGWCPPKEN